LFYSIGKRGLILPNCERRKIVEFIDEALESSVLRILSYQTENYCLPTKQVEDFRKEKEVTHKNT
jgi:hypothetical protein